MDRVITVIGKGLKISIFETFVKHNKGEGIIGRSVSSTGGTKSENGEVG